VVAHLRGCAGFWLYALAGALVTFSALAAASIGLLTVVPALFSLFIASRVARGPGEPLGIMTGAGLPCLAVAALNAGDHDVGGLAPQTWAVAGVLLITAGTVGYGLARRRAGRR
jgi:hypothetical protein